MDTRIKYLIMDIKWMCLNTFKFKGDLTMVLNGRVGHCLDEILLDEDRGGLLDCFFSQFMISETILAS